MKPTPDPDWKERREKIEGYYRDIGKMGMTDMGKIKAVVVKSGDKLIVEFDDGDGILYEIIEDLINPLRMIFFLSVIFQIIPVIRKFVVRFLMFL